MYGPDGMIAWQVRPYRADDITAVMEVVKAREAALRLGSMPDSAQIASTLHEPGTDPARNAVVVDGPRLDGIAEGGLLGAGSFTQGLNSKTGQRSYILHIWSHPAAMQLGVERAIMMRLFGLTRENEARPDAPRSTSARVYASYREALSSRKAIFELFGMEPARQFLLMERALDEPIDSPAEVQGVRLRTYWCPEDNSGACAAYNDSFSDHWDHFDETQESWDNAIAAPSRRPDLSWLAEIEDAPGTFGGFCICVIHEEGNKARGVQEGWIELLGTTRAWRGKGLGRSLLLHGLHSLKSAGMETATLTVDSESPTGANLLYEKVGFKVRQREFVYSVALDAAAF